jgi:addiction module HigA family antidote
MSIARSELKQQSFKGITTGRKLAPVHPGAVLLSDFIEPMGITRYRVAKSIGVQQRRIDEICAGERGITADTAVRLGLAFDVDPRFWLNLQAQYDIEVIRRDQGAQLAEEVHVLAASGVRGPSRCA